MAYIVFLVFKVNCNIINFHVYKEFVDKLYI